MSALPLWRDVPRYEGVYRVSSLGVVERIGGKALRPIPDKDGYLLVNLSRDGRARQFRVHVLVLLAFVGERPLGCIVAHGDGNNSNNSLANLRYATPQENEADKATHGTRAEGERHGCARITAETVKAIRRAGLSGVETARAFNISQSQAKRILKRQNWRCVA